MPLAILNRNRFVLGLLGVVLLGLLFPRLGAEDGPLKAGFLSQMGVMVIFFLQGLSLQTRELVSGLRDLRLHGFIQLWIFLFGAAILASAGLLLTATGQAPLAAGFFYLALVPTTISSAVAFTGTASGNVSVAIVNTTLSNVIGVFWVPFGCVLLFATGSGFHGHILTGLLTKLSWLILLPLVTGQILRPLVKDLRVFRFVRPHFKTVNNGIILLIVFSAFSESRLTNTWHSVSLWALAVLLALTALCVVVIHVAVWTSSRWFIPGIPERKAALFCGSQRTLAAGAPMALAIFSANGDMAPASLGLLLLPLLCYHPMQLFLAAALLPRLPEQASGKF